MAQRPTEGSLRRPMLREVAMTRAAKSCRVPRCPNLQPCPVHARKAWAGSRRRGELPPDWERRRRSVLSRDEVCTICDNALSTEVHHTGDKTDHRLEVLAGVCKRCHDGETQRQAAEARRR
jgi:hypothetical protein